MLTNKSPFESVMFSYNLYLNAFLKSLLTTSSLDPEIIKLARKTFNNTTFKLGGKTTDLVTVNYFICKKSVMVDEPTLWMYGQNITLH